MAIDRTMKEYILPDFETTFRLFAAHLRSVKEGWSYQEHTHPMFEVNMVTEGCQRMTVNGKTFLQKPGDMILLKPEDRHQSETEGSGIMTYYCLHFSVDDRFLCEVLRKNRVTFYGSPSPLARRIEPAIRKLMEITVAEEGFRSSHRMMALSSVFELFAGLSDVLSEQEGQAQSAAGSPHVVDAIAAKLEKYVEQGGCDDKDIVTQIAEQLGYSTSSCNRIFQQAFGQSPRQYLSALILKKAKLMLLEPDLPVEVISKRLGYSGITHFSRQFKRWTGESPNQFRSRFR